MKTKVATRIVLTVLLGGMLLAGISVLPVSAAYYYEEFKDGDWTGGSRSKTSSLADSDFDLGKGKLMVMAWAVGPSGTKWAEARIWIDFMFIHDTGAVCTFEFRYHIRGSMLWVGSGGCRFWLRAHLWCMNQPSDYVNGTFEDEDLGFLNPAWSRNHWETRTMQMSLTPGYTYRVEMHARAECIGSSSISGSYVYFMGTGLEGSRRVDWGYLRVYHGTYDATICADCNNEGADPGVSIYMDGSSTDFTTPHTFTGLIGHHRFTVPGTDPNGNYFEQWNTGETSTTITVTSGGTYTAKYYERAVGGIQVPVDKFGLLAPYIALAVALVAITVSAVYARKLWIRKAVVQTP